MKEDTPGTKAHELSDRELATLMLEYLELNEQLEKMSDKIKAAVMAREKTFAVADLEARYYKQSTRTDYKRAALAHLGDDLEPLDIFRKPPQYDYRAFCTQHELDLEPFKSIGSAPRVVLRFK